MKNIERCLDHPEEIGPVFQRSEKRLQIYVKYCQNKPTSEYIVSEHSVFFEVGHGQLLLKGCVLLAMTCWQIEELLLIPLNYASKKQVTSVFQMREQLVS